MSHFTKFTFLIIIIALGSSCRNTGNMAGKRSRDKELGQLQNLMAGKYTSEAQSKSDTSYFNISLVMTPIWNDRADGKWLYVEQALSSNLSKPYRQRVYHLQHPLDNVFTSDIYTLKDPASFVGLDKDDLKKKNLTFDKIDLKDGCTVTLNKSGDIYTGGTSGSNCPSDLRGAKYATTKITLKNGELDSWDRGFNAENKQVWGAVKGGYVFIKL